MPIFLYQLKKPKMEPKKFYQSTNFWIAVVLAVGGLFVGFPENDARLFVEGLFALIASAGVIRERLKDATIDWQSWIKSANTWNYLAAIIIAIAPAIPADLFLRLRELADAVLGGNWQGIITALFSIGTILFYTFRKVPAAAR